MPGTRPLPSRGDAVTSPEPPDDPKAHRVLLLCPSTGLGGGVERYVRSVESALKAQGIGVERLNLRTAAQRPPSLRQKAAFLATVVVAMRRATVPTRVVIAHPYLLPAVPVAARTRNYAGTTVIFYGSDVWRQRVPRWRRILGRPDVRVLAISAFTAGALVQTVNAVVVPPFIDREWFDRLTRAASSTTSCVDRGPVRVLTVLRLADWAGKGVPVLLEAVASLTGLVEVVIIGSGSVPDGLHDLVAAYPWARIEQNLSDDALAAMYADADIFVLATRTRPGPRASGEGFGLGLVEAQLAGTVVVAPAHGGSGDAFCNGITGLAPLDESPVALAHSLQALLGDQERRTRMSSEAASWSRSTFDPVRCAENLVGALL